MARSHGKLKCSIWQNPDFLALDDAPQRMFMVLLSQPKLSLVGCIDYMPRRWAKLSRGGTTAAVEASVATLEDAGFVCVDHDTEELLIRSFTRHDGITLANVKMVKGLWGAWEAIGSARLRKVAVDNMPDAFMSKATPEEAQDFRRSEPMEWVTDRTMEHTNDQADDPTTLQPPPSTLLTPSSGTRSIVVPGSGAVPYYETPNPEPRGGVDFDELRGGMSPVFARKGAGEAS